MPRVTDFHLAFVLLMVLSSSAVAQESLPDLVRRIKPAVVTVIIYDDKGNVAGSGSGFFVGPDRVVTNQHVVQGAYRAEVKMITDRAYPVKGLLAVDGEADIVLLQVDVPANLVTPLIVSRTFPQEGESIVVIGNPLGFLEGSVSTGVVSAVRNIPRLGRLIQITAPVSPGSSGSAVVNMRGQVIGIVRGAFEAGQNLNIAVPGERITQLQPGSVRTLAAWRIEMKGNRRSAAEQIFNKGNEYRAVDNCEKALSYFEQSIRIDHDYATAWFAVGNCNYDLGRYSEAGEAYKQVLRLEPEDAETHNNLGNVYIQLKRYDEALGSFKQSLRFDPNSAMTYSNMAVAYGRLGLHEEEVRLSKQAVRLNPNYATAHHKLARAYVTLERYNEAIESYKQVIRLNPSDAQACFDLGKTYGDIGRTDQELDWYKQVIRLKPSFADAHYNLA